jgi:xanthine dehydrogenase accessory factor
MRLQEAAGKYLTAGKKAVLVEITAASGSTPRNRGTKMLVGMQETILTIGGGRLEFIAIEHARKMLNGEDVETRLNIPLGPEIGQCCGGRVSLAFSVLTDQASVLEESTPNLPMIQIHGAGHTGRALANSLALLPFDVGLFDTRKEALENAERPIEGQLTALPEAEIARASAGAAFVVLTHDHQLDFMIATQALARKDAAYVGMIGSKTKRAVFTNWLSDNGFDSELAKRLVCPIGGNNVKDKRPEIIAALVAAELIAVFAHQE